VNLYYAITFATSFILTTVVSLLLDYPVEVPFVMFFYIPISLIICWQIFQLLSKYQRQTTSMVKILTILGSAFITSIISMLITVAVLNVFVLAHQ